MNTDHIATLCLWIDCSESDIINVAHMARYGVNGGSPLPQDFNDYAEGNIPPYVEQFILERIYPGLVVGTKQLYLPKEI